MFNNNTNKIAETARQIMAGESIEESVNEAKNDIKVGQVLMVDIGYSMLPRSGEYQVKITKISNDDIHFDKIGKMRKDKSGKWYLEPMKPKAGILKKDRFLKSIKESVNEATGDKEAYQKFFNKTLKKYGVKSPSELKGDDEKKFYDEIDAGWKGDDEKNESVELEDDEGDVEEGLVGNLIKKGAKRFLTRKGRNDARAKKLKKLKNKEAEIRRSKQLKRDIKNAKRDIKKARASKRVQKTRNESVELEEGKIDLKKKVKNEKEFESYMDSFKGPDILAAVEKLDSGEKHQKGTVGFFLSQQMSMKEGTLKLDARRREFREKIKKLAYAKAKKMIQDEEGDEEEEEEKDTE